MTPPATKVDFSYLSSLQGHTADDVAQQLSRPIHSIVRELNAARLAGLVFRQVDGDPEMYPRPVARWWPRELQHG